MAMGSDQRPDQTGSETRLGQAAEGRDRQVTRVGHPHPRSVVTVGIHPTKVYEVDNDGLLRLEHLLKHRICQCATETHGEATVEVWVSSMQAVYSLYGLY